MQVWRHLLCLWIICCLSCNAQAKSKVRSHPIYGTDELVAEINRILQNTDPNATIGIHIKSMKYGDTLFAQNTQKLFTPASILKIFTAEAALLYLGPQYTFPTRLATDSTAVNNGKLHGNVYLVHSGDPSLTYKDLAGLVTTLKSQQIQAITGNVYIDNTAYDQVGFGPGWMGDDTRYCYAAPISASIINRNCLSFKVAPAKKPGRTANILPNPHYYYGNIVNDVITKSSRTRSCYLRLGTTSNAISISGCVPKGHYAQGVSAVIANIVQYNKSLLQSLLNRFGIHVQGNIDMGAAPPNSSILAMHESKPLNLLVREMLKMSDNVIAGSLFKKIGEIYTNEPGSWQNGSKAVKEILAQKAGVDTAQMYIIDGSGLSQENQIKPIQMMQVLEFAFHNPATNYEFISGLPIAGVDGTLKHRLYNVARRIRAKTGTMSGSGVVSLAGYALNKNKEPIAFVIIVNGKNGNAWKYREMEDKIVTALANFQRET